MASILKRTYKQEQPDGTFKVKKCRCWTIQYFDAAGKLRRIKGYTDLAATRQKAAELDRALARGETGLVDLYREHKARGTSEHIKDWLADLTTAGRSWKYIDNCEKRMKILREACGWDTLQKIDANSFIKWRESHKIIAHNDTDKAAATTLNQYLDTARAFLNWAVEPGKRLPANPLANVVKVEGPKLRKRRALTDEQVSALLAVAGDRKLVYRFGLATGLRRAEIAALQWGDVRLNAIKPYIQLRSEATKARRGDRLPLPATLVDDLRTHRPADVKDDARVFAEVPPIEQWKSDLAAAAIPYKDDQGRQADFHGGTRKTLCTRLHRSGVPLATAMRMMRHTDARLTMVDYADDGQLSAVDALLPELSAAARPETPPATVAAGA